MQYSCYLKRLCCLEKKNNNLQQSFICTFHEFHLQRAYILQFHRFIVSCSKLLATPKKPPQFGSKHWFAHKNCCQKFFFFFRIY